MDVASQIITGVLTLLGVAVGAVLGAWLKSKSDKERELRAEKRVAYVDLIQRLSAFDHALIPLGAAALRRDEEAILGAAEQTRLALAQVDAAVSVVRLIAPSNRDAELEEILTVCIAAMSDASGLSAASDRDKGELYAAFKRVLALARSELGLAP